MSNWKTILAFVFQCLLTVSAFSQENYLNKAQVAFQSGEILEAKEILEINKVELESVGANYYYFRGYVYKEIYKQNLQKENGYDLRISSLNSFKQAFLIGEAGDYKQDIKKNIRYLLLSIFNQELTRLQEVNFTGQSSWQPLFDDYKAYSTIDDDEYKKLVLNYKTALGEAYLRAASKSSSSNKSAYTDSALVIYKSILITDGASFNANYNVGIIYYNQAVDMIDGMGLVTLEDLREIESNSNSLFLKALPFMEKAYAVNPENKSVIEALAGIHFSLKNFEKSNKYMSLLK